MTPSLPPRPARCPCQSGETYPDCCGRFHRGASTLSTAERLMRARYSAFALGEPEYLLSTWHPSTRPHSLELDSGLRWTRLDIVRIERGGALDTEGIVEFVAHFRSEGRDHEQREVSRFGRVAREWRYIEPVGP